MKIRSLFLITVLALMVPVSAMAEGFSDLYVGFAKSQNQDLTAGNILIEEETEFEGGISAGYRIGYWLESAPYVGLALEVSYFEQDVEDFAELGIIPITPMLMLRIPLLKSPEFPTGEWQPYVGVGPGIAAEGLEAI